MARRFVPAAACTAAVLLLPAAARASVPAGTLDQSFGSGGLTVVDHSSGVTTLAGPVVERDGTVVVAGEGYVEATATAPSAWCGFLLRFTSSGALDPTFGLGGLVWNCHAGGFRAILLQADGKIVAIARTCVARYLPDGTLDQSFGGSGEVTRQILGNGTIAGAIAPDGKIVVASNAESNPASGSIDEVVVTRYLSDGSPDAAFGNGGAAVVHSGDTVPQGVAALADGSVVVTAQTESQSGLLMTRLSSSGAFVGSSEDDTLTASPGILGVPDGGFYVTGWTPGSSGAPGQAFVARFDSSGSRVASYGSNGVALVPPAGGGDRSFGWGIALDASGRIVVAGSSWIDRPTTLNSFWEIEVARLLPSGTLDASFANGGIETLPVEDAATRTQNITARGRGVAFQSDGRVVVAAEAPSDVMLTRLAEDGSTLSADTTPPDTTTTMPPSSRVGYQTGAEPTFGSSENGSSFRCSVDGQAATLCFPGWETPLWTSGTHTVSIAAVDNAGNVDPTPVTLTYTVDPPPSSAPGNDDFGAASVLSGASGSVGGSNVGATLQAGEPDHAGVPEGASVWYRWTAPAAGSVTITTQGSSYDTVLAVYTGGSLSGLSAVAANDDVGGGANWSSVTFAASAGTTYQIAVAGYNSSSSGVRTGSITLNWQGP